MKIQNNLKTAITFALIIAFLLIMIPFPAAASLGETVNFADFTETDAMAFVEQYNIDIPTKLMQSENLPYFTLNLILHSYYHPNTAFCFNYSQTQIYAEEIRATVRSCMNLEANLTVASETAYELQYNQVMDEEGEWGTSNGAFNPKWYDYNCYAYAINRVEQPQFYPSGYYIQYQPGDMSGNGDFASITTIFELAELIRDDLLAMNYSNVSLSSTLPIVDESKELICVRMNDEDYHFMHFDSETNAWYHKPGNTAILKYNDVPTNNLLWYMEYSFNGVEGKAID